jgi:hypothetical protein
LVVLGLRVTPGNSLSLESYEPRAICILRSSRYAGLS